MEDLKNSNDLRPVKIPFMGGTVVIAPAGSFADKETGKTVTYDAKVKLGSLVDSKGNVPAAVFLEMLKAVSADKEAMLLLNRI